MTLPTPSEQEEQDHFVAELRALLGASDFTAAHTKGGTLSLERAVVLAAAPDAAPSQEV